MGNDIALHKDEANTITLSMNNRIQIIDEGLRKNYLSRLNEMEVAPIDQSILPPLEEDMIDNVRLYHITEMVYQQGEKELEKLTTVYNTLSTYNASLFLLMNSDGKKTDFYIGVRNNEQNDMFKRSTVTLGDTLKNALIGHFPGIKIENENRNKIALLSEIIKNLHNVASVSVVGNEKGQRSDKEGQYVQGLEKLVLAMQGRAYTGIIVAKNQSPADIERLRHNYEDLYTKLTPYQKIQVSDTSSNSASRSKSFFEMTGEQKAAMIGGSLSGTIGALAGFALTGGLAGAAAAATSAKSAKAASATMMAMIGGQAGSSIGNFINSLAPNEQISSSSSHTESTTTENKTVTDLLSHIDDTLKRIDEFESYGMWNVAGYFLSDDMSAAEIAASNYRSIMNGEKSGREVSAINSWRSNDVNISGSYSDLTTYLSRFLHPQFVYGSGEEGCVYTDASAAISGRELGIHMGIPRASVPGLPVIEHAEFGKEVYSYRLFGGTKEARPEDRMTLGRVFDLGRITDKKVELDNKSLNMHTFITGSTGSGKSNTVYQMLAELHQDGIPFLVVEPAKGEYKDVFGSWHDVNVYSTNPEVAELININPFRFPKTIHILEHIDGLVEIFSACWPMYDAMPAFFKEAILRSYESVGWDLGASVCESKDPEYPDFDVLADELDKLIEKSDYASDIKSNYRGALITRVKSLAVGLNKFIFTKEQTPYEKLFDENCILDISRIKSGETKALIMGLMVYILNEYRMDKKTANNNGLKHVTVLEEAHNLLKNTSGRGSSDGGSDLIGKSVEMITQTIAEIRTYGEGFIIVDQSPSSVDIAAIKNTNTKIVLRTPEANDREAVGLSMGLNKEQVNEIAKLPSGVAVVYQNNWVKPVLTLINKADVKESKYIPEHTTRIMTQRAARTMLIEMLMQPWINRRLISEEKLNGSLRVIDVDRSCRRELEKLIDTYTLMAGNMVWKEEEVGKLQRLLQTVMGIENADFMEISGPDELRAIVSRKLKGLNKEEIESICWALTVSSDKQNIK